MNFCETNIFAVKLYDAAMHSVRNKTNRKVSRELSVAIYRSIIMREHDKIVAKVYEPILDNILRPVETSIETKLKSYFLNNEPVWHYKE